MFDSIAGDYDALNHILSLDVDKIWRKKALKQIVDAPAPARVLDLACGTGDFSIAIAKALSRSHKRVGTPIEAHVKAPAKVPVEAPVEAPAKAPVEAQVTSTGFVTGDSERSDLMTKGHVTGVDLSEGMLAVMREKVAKAGLTEMISIEEGDGENLRFPDSTFDRVTIAFGIRNFEDRPKGLREMLRVLKPGGRLVILELSRPENKVIRWFYDLYFLHTSSRRSAARSPVTRPPTPTSPPLWPPSPAKRRSWPRCARPASAPSPTKPSPSASAGCTPARNREKSVASKLLNIKIINYVLVGDIAPGHSVFP